MGDSFRQEVFNVLLAQVLQERGVVSVPERIIKAGPGKWRKMPDILVNFSGLRLVLEGELGDKPGAKERALASARKRVEDGIAHIGVAIIYPASLSQIGDLTELKAQIADCQLEMAVIAESEAEVKGFSSGSINHLADVLRKTFDQLVKEDVVTQAAALIDAGVDDLAMAIIHSEGFVEKAAQALGIKALPARQKSTAKEESE